MGLVPNIHLSKKQLLKLEQTQKIFCEIKMAPNNQQDQNSGTNWQEEATRQATMYPNLEEFLSRMMPENQSEFLREFFNQNPNGNNAGSNAPPSAPPAQENSEENGANNSAGTGNNSENAGGWNWQNWADNWQKYHDQQQQQQRRPNNSEENGANNSAGNNSGNNSGNDSRNNSGNTRGWNWQNYHAQQQQQQQRRRPNNSQNNERTGMFNEDDHVSILLQRIGQKMAENFAKVIGFVAFMLPILIVPKYFLALGIFAAFMKSFGVPLTPLVLGGIFYEIITALDPILLTLLGVWTILKVFILRRPLVDINYWKHRMNARCCYSRRSN